MSIESLKAKAYDLRIARDRIDNDLAQLNTAIIFKLQKEQDKKRKEELEEREKESKKEKKS